MKFLKPFFHGFDSKPKELPYRKQKRLMTKSETDFFRALLHAYGNEYLIFTQININNLLDVVSYDDNRFYWEWRSKIDRKSVDFVLCDPVDSSIILSIELDDKTHERKYRKQRDKFVDQAFEAAGAKLLRIKASNKYNPEAIRLIIDSFLQE